MQARCSEIWPSPREPIRVLAVRARYAPGLLAALGVAIVSACAYGGPRSPAEARVASAHVGTSAKRPATKQAAPSDEENAEEPAHTERPTHVDAGGGNEPFREPVTDKLGSSAPAVRFAEMSQAECLREVERDSVALKRETKAEDGIATPVRITGPLRGVKFVVPGPSSKFGVLDCRLGLALDELAGSLASYDVVAVHVDNFYRPHAKLPGKSKNSQHAFGLAADITSIELKDGRKLTPVEDWRAEIGETPCGPAAVMSGDASSAADATMLRNVVCDVARKGLFHDVLTPSFNAAHKSHFHFDIKHNTAHQALR